MTTQIVNAPIGIEIFDGATVGSFRSADGMIYVVYCGERTGMKFGTYVWRTNETRVEWVELPEYIAVRVDAHVEPDGLYLTWPVNRNRQVARLKVAGFVTPAYPGGTQSFPPSPVTVAVVDTVARTTINTTRAELNSALSSLKKSLESKIAALPKPQSGISEQSAKDIAWSIAADRFYHELNTSNSPVRNLIAQMIRSITDK